MKTYKEKAFQGKEPQFHENCFVADGAQVAGDVTVGEYSSIWYKCALRGDDNKITIGRYTNIQDGTVIHLDDDYPCTLGDYVTVGHKAIVHGCTVEDYCLIGMKSTIMDGAVIGKGSIVAAGAVVPSHMKVPPLSLVAGIPAKVIKTLSERSLQDRKDHAVSYKTLWAEYYKIIPDNDGEKFARNIRQNIKD